MTVAYSDTGSGASMANNGGTSGSGNLSWTHTGTGGAYGLVFCTGFGGQPTAVTFGGNAMTQLASVLLNNNAGIGNMRDSIDRLYAAQCYLLKNVDVLATLAGRSD